MEMMNKIYIKDKEIYEFMQNEFMGQLSDGHYENTNLTRGAWNVDLIYAPYLEQDFKIIYTSYLGTKKEFKSYKDLMKETNYLKVVKIGNPYKMIKEWKKDNDAGDDYSWILEKGRFNDKEHTWEELFKICKKAQLLWNGVE